ncbi:hypothetical protein ACP70R_008325 [Stipagrostis hirtigluma subsp. patula]
MASSTKLPFLLLVVIFAALAASAAPAAQAAAEEYCRDTLAGLMDCQGFMFHGAPAPSAACCAAYGAAFDADPFCLCYVADGTYGRATGLDVNVTRALQIPAGCGQAAPPVELCSMQGLQLPPYDQPAQSPATAASPTAQPPSGSAQRPSLAPPPPSTSGADSDAADLMILLAAAIFFFGWA